jgi:sec-independent protein translocase protein TatA
MKPWHVVVLIVVLILVFGSRKLPDIAKSIGQSLKVFKKEVTELQQDTSPPDAAPPAAAPPSAGPPPAVPDAAPKDPPSQ